MSVVLRLRRSVRRAGCRLPSSGPPVDSRCGTEDLLPYSPDVPRGHGSRDPAAVSRRCSSSVNSRLASFDCWYAAQRLVASSFPVEVVQRNRAAAVRAGGDGHHSIGHVRQQQIGEREVAEMVGTDLQLEAVDSTPFGCSHHAGVVDQHVELTLPTVRERAYRGQVGKIEMANLTVAGNGLERPLRPWQGRVRRARHVHRPRRAPARSGVRFRYWRR